MLGNRTTRLLQYATCIGVLFILVDNQVAESFWLLELFICAGRDFHASDSSDDEAFLFKKVNTNNSSSILILFQEEHMLRTLLIVSSLGLFLLIPAANSQIPTNGLVAYYPFNGNANDSSGNGNNGSVYNISSDSDRFGQAGKSFHFNGVNSIVTINDSTLFNFGTNDFSISLWTRTSVEQPGIYLISKYALPDGSPGYGVGTGDFTDPYAFLTIQSGTSRDVRGAIPFNDGMWHNIICVWQRNGRLTIFFDGNNLASTDISSYSNGVVQNNAKLNIGGRANYPQFNGDIDDIRIYNRALNVTEIGSLYHEGGWPNPIPTNGLVAWYPFNGNANDSSGNGNNGTVNGATLSTDRFGQPNHCYSFDGNSNYIGVRDTQSLNFGTNDFSISLWAQTSVSQAGCYFIAKYPVQDGPGYGIGTTANNDPYAFMFDDLGLSMDRDTYSGGRPINDGLWHNYTVVWDRKGFLTIYVDSVATTQRDMSDASAGSVSNDGILTIGGRENSQLFSGELDDIRIYNRVLDTAEIGSLYHEGGWTLPLPVELTSFTAAANSNTADLKWNTATEVNNYGFEVQRTVNSGSWAKVSFVAGNGTSNVPHNYSYTDKVGTAGTYSYRLKQIDHNGAFVYSQVVQVTIEAPKVFALNQNYPNPFNPKTDIQFTVPSDGRATLKIFNTLGQEVATLFDGAATAGEYHQATFDASQLASGIYFSRLEFNGKMQVKKMLLLK
jgi:hypothetical protein